MPERLKSPSRDVMSDQSHGLTRILDATERLLVRVGNAGLTMRAIAEEAGVAVGTVSHFGTRDELIESCVRRLFDWYFEEFTALSDALAGEPREAFYALIRFIVDDLESERTARLFPEIWAIGNNNPEVQSALDWLYERERDWLEEQLRAGWPGLTGDQVKLVIGTLLPMIEGHGVFAPAHRANLYPDFKAADAISAWLEALLEKLEAQAKTQETGASRHMPHGEQG